MSLISKQNIKTLSRVTVCAAGGMLTTSYNKSEGKTFNYYSFCKLH